MTSPIRRIMIVDDHQAIRRGVRQIVESKAYFQVVGEAADGRTALELAKETRPDIAIIDFSVPELNGLDLSHALKRELPRIEITPRVRTIVAGCAVSHTSRCAIRMRRSACWKKRVHSASPPSTFLPFPRGRKR